MPGDLRIDSYAWQGGCESLLRFGPDGGPVVVAALPLFEEANRTRAFVVTILRALAERGIAGVLPDLPGTGDSLIATADARLATMRRAHDELVEQLGRSGRVHALGVRSGALIDDAATVATRWHLAPQSGGDVLRDLSRLARAGSTADRNAATNDRPFGDAPVTVAGNALSAAMLADLAIAVPFAPAGGVPLRVVRLDSDPRPADHKLPGTPLWRRTEPGNDLSLAQTLAGDIGDWIAACDG